jgi:hypothetical protein
MKRIYSIFFLATVVFLAACNKKENLEIEKANDYYPMTVGKYITYKLDSTIYIGYTVTPVVRSYYVQDRVDAAITDNLGRPSYRIIRYIKKNLTDPNWTPSNTFMVTQLENVVEYLENNLRYIRLQNPVKNDYSWKGNSYIESSGQFSQLQYLFDWEYQYANVKETKAYGSLSFAETITVNQADATDGIITDPNGYSERNYSIETFAKGTGLVYKEFLHWSYQPPSGSTPGYRTGYGVKLTIVDKN